MVPSRQERNHLRADGYYRSSGQAKTARTALVCFRDAPHLDLVSTMRILLGDVGLESADGRIGDACARAGFHERVGFGKNTVSGSPLKCASHVSRSAPRRRAIA